MANTWGDNTFTTSHTKCPMTMDCLRVGPWSTVTATKWETAFFKSVFLKLDHHLTWDQSFHIENDNEIYQKFHEWLFNRQLPTDKRVFQYVSIYNIMYTVALLLYSVLHKEWATAVVVFVTHGAMFPFYHKYAIAFSELDEFRSITSGTQKDANSALQSLNEDGQVLQRLETMSISKTITMGTNEADIVFAKGSLIPFIIHCTVTTTLDIAFTNHAFVICFPLIIQMFVAVRCLLLPINLTISNRTDLFVFGLTTLSMVLQAIFNPNVVTWDESLCAVFSCLFAIMCCRYYGLLILDATRKEFKRKNRMMSERYKTETLVQKVLPPEITQEMRQYPNHKSKRTETTKLNDSNPAIERRKEVHIRHDVASHDVACHQDIHLKHKNRAPIHDKCATVAFVKISLFDSNRNKIDDDEHPEIVVNSLHQIVKKFDKIIFLYSGVHKVEHVANTYLLCSGLLQEDIPDDIHPKLMIRACVALQDICSTMRLKNGRFVQITVGIHSGNVLGTVVGAQRRFFRIFGDTVNTASRICSTGIKYKINVSDIVHQCVENTDNFQWESRENVSMKGKGTMNCMVLQHLAHRQSVSLHSKFEASRLHSAETKSRFSQPRWMVKGSLMVKQNTKQSSSVFVSRIQEVTNMLTHHPLTLWFRDIAIQRRSSEVSEADAMECGTRAVVRMNSLSGDSSTGAAAWEAAFRDEWFQTRKRIANWFLFIAYLFSVSCFAVYTASVLLNDKGFPPMIIPLFTFTMCSLAYLSQSLFLSYQMRRTTEIFECLTVIFSSVTTLFCTSYFRLSLTHNSDVLFFVVLCASLSKMSHFLNIATCSLLLVCHIVLFWWQIRELMALYIMIELGAFILFSSFKYRIEYKLRELFIVNLAYQRDQISITKELSTLLPGFVIERMIGSQRNNRQQIVDKFNNATVFESDLVGFTKFSSTRTPAQIVAFLNELYTKLDAQCVAFGLEKIDSIGDAYICISFTGSPDPVLQFALKLVEDICDDDDVVGMRVGIATGYAIGTVLGECTKRYAVFGAALNRAIKLEESSKNKRILCCSNTVKRASKTFQFIPFADDQPETNSFWLRRKSTMMAKEQ